LLSKELLNDHQFVLSTVDILIRNNTSEHKIINMLEINFGANIMMENIRPFLKEYLCSYRVKVLHNHINEIPEETCRLFSIEHWDYTKANISDLCKPLSQGINFTIQSIL
jgi:hypothetical protein